MASDIGYITGCVYRASINHRRNNIRRILILKNSVFNGIPRNFTKFRNLFPAEFKNSVKFCRNFVQRSCAGRWI